ncbi:MAG: amidohydrolase family protein [Thermotogota bacterium]|nr:amidohydrolase family protein [Thermotogota bacterium]
MNKKLFKNYLIFSGCDPHDLFMGSILVDNGEIVEIIKGVDIPDHLDAQEIEGNGKILMPGFINLHTHIYSTFARGMGFSPFNPSAFRELLEQLWWRLDRALNIEDVYYSALTASIEMVRNGVTTFVDHHSSPNATRGSLNQIVKACIQEGGMRGIVCYETSDRDGKKVKREAIAENLEAQSLVKQYPARAAGLFGLHASFTLEDETLSACADSGVPIHVHVGEGPEDGQTHLEKYQISPIERFEHFGLLNDQSLLVHCLHVQDSDLPIIKKNGSRVVFNPQSNMNNGAGLPDYSKFKNYDIPVNLGNDGYGFDLTRDMRMLLLSQHLLKKDPVAFSVEDLFDVVFRNNANYVSKTLQTKLGKIEQGYKADFVTFDYQPPTPMNGDNFLSHFYFAIIENCKPVDVFVNGDYLLRDGQFTLLDEEQILKASKKQAESLWKRI